MAKLYLRTRIYTLILDSMGDIGREANLEITVFNFLFTVTTRWSILDQLKPFFSISQNQNVLDFIGVDHNGDASITFILLYCTI